MIEPMATPSRADSVLRWVLALLSIVLTGAGSLAGAAPASAATSTYAYDSAGYTYDAPALLSSPDTAALYVRGSPSGLAAAAWEGSVAAGGRGVAANSGTARFVASSDGVVTNLVGSRNAISIGHYPEYAANAQATGARTFSMADDAWNAISPTEQWVRNQRFLDDAISRGSEIQLATPLSQVRAGSFLEREIAYLSGRGYVPNSSGTLMIPGGG